MESPLVSRYREPEFDVSWLLMIIMLPAIADRKGLPLWVIAPILQTTACRPVLVSVVIPNDNKGPYIEPAGKTVLR
jgi:hypothetical protein